jgi:hypothetical protein
MTDRRLTAASVVLALAGLGLIGFETVRAFNGDVIGTVGAILLYVGVGLFVLAAVIVVVDLTSGPSEPAHNGGHPPARVSPPRSSGWAQRTVVCWFGPVGVRPPRSASAPESHPR